MKQNILKKIFNNITKDKNNCWIYNGYTGTKGYARIHYKGREINGHRIVLIETTGRNPKLDACHSCDNRKCVNPEHLFWGTRKENMRDMVNKGRHWMKQKPDHILKGETHPSTKLTKSQVLKIYEMAHGFQLSQRQIANIFGISQATVAAIKFRRIWKHLDYKKIKR